MQRYNFKKKVSNLKRKIHEQNIPTRKQAILANRKFDEKIDKSTNSAFLSGGIGDVIAVESFLSNQMRQNLTTIFYGTHKRNHIEILFNAIKTFPNLKNHVALWENFSTFWCFHSLDECISKCKSSGIEFDDEAIHSKDLSIGKVFSEIEKKNMDYTGSSFLKNKLTEIFHFNLPPNFVVVLPYSTDKRLEERDFCPNDWKHLLRILEREQIHGVVINSENEPVPDNQWLINLSQKTSLLEAIEILKKSRGYFGIDSWLSVLSAKLFDYPNLQIKTNNYHCINNAYFYFAPKKNFNFIVKNIK